MGLPELVELLDDLEERRTPIGWSPDDAVQRAAIERRIMALVGQDPPEDERRGTVRLPCELPVKLRSKERSVRAEVRDIGAGGVFVLTDTPFVVGTVVELEVRGNGTDEHGLRVRGQIAWNADGDSTGVGVCFNQVPSSAHERRIRRFVIELLRHRSQN
ncbi:MAG TPA: PilZ domain-containing protein [Kofleriaceae bacterium]|nr:PilZ domain-containing protein [Kofleriaceae bacterium]